MKIGVLTSSRADFGIYLPLLRELKNDKNIDLRIIAFGTHCSDFHGKTINKIIESGFNTIDKLSTVLASDDEVSIATSYGLTVLKFAEYWNEHQYDLVFCLGDRYEMSAAVQAGIPFQIIFAHIHGGETTLGAIDNIYRHQITLASTFHFTSTKEYAEKVASLMGSNKNIHNVGSLALDGLEEMDCISEEKLRKDYQIPTGKYILTTFHPETVAAEKNKIYAGVMLKALSELCEDFIFVITMPNADTMGSVFREEIYSLKKHHPHRIVLIENFGKTNYFSAMKYASFLLGNTSSGIIEAASFHKYVVNVGDRQKGRAQSDNVINCRFEYSEIQEAVNRVNKLGAFNGANIYRKENTVKNILKVINNSNEKL